MNENEKHEFKAYKDMTFENSSEIFNLEGEFEELKRAFREQEMKRIKRDMCLYGCFFSGTLLIILGQLFNYFKG